MELESPGFSEFDFELILDLSVWWAPEGSKPEVGVCRELGSTWVAATMQGGDMQLVNPPTVSRCRRVAGINWRL